MSEQTEVEGISERWMKKKLCRELPTIKKKKTREPNKYERHKNCVRCGEMEETQEHIWECRMARTKITQMVIGVREEMEKGIRNESKGNSRRREIKEKMDEDKMELK